MRGVDADHAGAFVGVWIQGNEDAARHDVDGERAEDNARLSCIQPRADWTGQVQDGARFFAAKIDAWSREWSPRLVVGGDGADVLVVKPQLVRRERDAQELVAFARATP